MTRLRALALAALALAPPGPASAVVGGREAPGAGSGVVMVLDSRGGVCSGVVVARDVVLTAAHCVTGAPEHRVHWRDEAGAPVLVIPAARAVHPGYDAAAIERRRRSIDLALVRLPEPLPSRFVPARLATRAAARDEAVTVVGYGVAREGDPRSSGTLRAAALAVVEPHGPSRILVWARGEAGAGACRGDSGGPILRADTVVAVTTWAAGTGRAGCGGLTQGVLAGPQRDWIDRTMRAWGREAAWE